MRIAGVRNSVIAMLVSYAQNSSENCLALSTGNPVLETSLDLVHSGRAECTILNSEQWLEKIKMSEVLVPNNIMETYNSDEWLPRPQQLADFDELCKKLESCERCELSERLVEESVCHAILQPSTIRMLVNGEENSSENCLALSTGNPVLETSLDLDHSGRAEFIILKSEQWLEQIKMIDIMETYNFDELLPRSQQQAVVTAHFDELRNRLLESFGCELNPESLALYIEKTEKIYESERLVEESVCHAIVQPSTSGATQAKPFIGGFIKLLSENYWVCKTVRELFTHLADEALGKAKEMVQSQSSSYTPALKDDELKRFQVFITVAGRINDVSSTNGVEDGEH